MGKNGRILFERPKPTVGCSASGRRSNNSQAIMGKPKSLSNIFPKLMFGHKHKVPSSFTTVKEKGLVLPVFRVFPVLFHPMTNRYFIDVTFRNIGVGSLTMAAKLKHVAAN
jgi:hypothetical protein